MDNIQRLAIILFALLPFWQEYDDNEKFFFYAGFATMCGFTAIGMVIILTILGY